MLTQFYKDKVAESLIPFLANALYCLKNPEKQKAENFSKDEIDTINIFFKADGSITPEQKGLVKTCIFKSERENFFGLEGAQKNEYEKLFVDNLYKFLDFDSKHTHLVSSADTNGLGTGLVETGQLNSSFFALAYSSLTPMFMQEVNELEKSNLLGSDENPDDYILMVKPGSQAGSTDTSLALNRNNLIGVPKSAFKDSASILKVPGFEGVDPAKLIPADYRGKLSPEKAAEGYFQNREESTQDITGEVNINSVDSQSDIKEVSYSQISDDAETNTAISKFQNTLDSDNTVIKIDGNFKSDTHVLVELKFPDKNGNKHVLVPKNNPDLEAHSLTKEQYDKVKDGVPMEDIVNVQVDYDRKKTPEEEEKEAKESKKDGSKSGNKAEVQARTISTSPKPGPKVVPKPIKPSQSSPLKPGEIPGRGQKGIDALTGGPASEVVNFTPTGITEGINIANRNTPDKTKSDNPAPDKVNDIKDIIKTPESGASTTTPDMSGSEGDAYYSSPSASGENMSYPEGSEEHKDFIPRKQSFTPVKEMPKKSEAIDDSGNEMHSRNFTPVRGPISTTRGGDKGRKKRVTGKTPENLCKDTSFDRSNPDNPATMSSNPPPESDGGEVETNQNMTPMAAANSPASSQTKQGKKGAAFKKLAYGAGAGAGFIGGFMLLS